MKIVCAGGCEHIHAFVCKLFIDHIVSEQCCPQGSACDVLLTVLMLLRCLFVTAGHANWLQDFCCTSDLRFMNAILGAVNLVLAANLHSVIHDNVPSKTTSLLMGFCIVMSPIHFFFTNLFYTDISSLTSILACHLSVRTQRRVLGFFFAVFAIFVRQTNIVWVCFVYFDSILEDLKIQEVCSSIPCVDLLHQSSCLIRKIIHHRLHLIRNFWAIVVLPTGFYCFVLWNGGIVVGDKQAHKPVVHTAQIAYFFLFLLGCGLPLFALSDVSHGVLHTAYRKPLQSGFLLILCFLLLQWGTYIHQYTLADNRHFTFYVWRWFLSHEWFRSCLSPVVWYSVMSTAQLMSSTQTALWMVGFMACGAAVLIPAGLLEFRWM